MLAETVWNSLDYGSGPRLRIPRQGFSEQTQHDGHHDPLHGCEESMAAARTEKAGGVFKDKLRLVLEETQATTDEEFNQCVAETQIARNRYFHWGGFSPYQRVFGFNPRFPASLASDDIMSPILLDSGAAEPIRKACEFRAAWMRHLDEDAIKRIPAMPRT